MLKDFCKLLTIIQVFIFSQNNWQKKVEASIVEDRTHVGQRGLPKVRPAKSSKRFE